MAKQIALSVADLATKANEAAASAQTYAANSVSKAIEAGRYLNQAKKQLPHGSWLSWLAENFEYGATWGRQLMRIADNAKKLELEGAKTVREAVRIMADSEEKRVKPRAPAQNGSALPFSPSGGGDEADEEYEDVEEAEFELVQPSGNGKPETTPEPEPVDPSEQYKQNRQAVKAYIEKAQRAVDDLHEVRPNKRRQNDVIKLLQQAWGNVW